MKSSALKLSILIFFSLFCIFKSQAQTGPWNSALMITTSSNGTTFNAAQTFQDSSGVPSVIMLSDGRLICAFQWFPAPLHSDNWDSVAVKFSYDTASTWTAPFHCNFTGMPANFKRPFDPTLSQISTGQIRMYFSSGPNSSMQLDSTVNTYSAISTDGINYAFEGSVRFDDPNLPVIDPAVTLFNGTYHYTAPRGAPQDGAFHATSLDGLTFTQLSNITSDNLHQWTGNLMVAGSIIRFYGAGGGSIWWSSTTDGNTWSGYTATNVVGGDPSALLLPDGTYLMIYVGPPSVSFVTENNSTDPASLFPNPANEQINISSDSDSDVQFNLFSSDGKLLRSEKIESHSQKIILLSDLSPGFYIYTMNGIEMKAGRLVITH